MAQPKPPKTARAGVSRGRAKTAASGAGKVRGLSRTRRKKRARSFNRASSPLSRFINAVRRNGKWVLIGALCALIAVGVVLVIAFVA